MRLEKFATVTPEIIKGPGFAADGLEHPTLGSW